MRILVTGAGGFIGARVVQELVEAGHEVAALLRVTGDYRRLSKCLSRITVVRADLSNSEALGAAITHYRPEGCIHLAWYAVPGSYLTSVQNVASLEASLQLLRLLSDVGCQNIVAAGTCAEYAPADAPLLEDSPTRPETLYAATKFAFGLVGREFAACNGVNFAWGRIFHLYGPEEDKRRMVPALVDALLAGRPFHASAGDQVRDYLHVDDVARAFRTLIEREATGVFNIASGEAVTIRELMETAQRIAGRSELVRFGERESRSVWDPPMLVGDSHKLRQLGWQPRVDLAAGFAALLRERGTARPAA